MLPRISLPTYAVMLALAASGEDYAQSLADRVGASTRDIVHRSLDRLRLRAWATSREEGPDTRRPGSPPRVYYRLTTAGRLALADIRAQLSHLLAAVPADGIEQLVSPDPRPVAADLDGHAATVLCDDDFGLNTRVLVDNPLPDRGRDDVDPEDGCL